MLPVPEQGMILEPGMILEQGMILEPGMILEGDAGAQLTSPKLSDEAVVLAEGIKRPARLPSGK